ncbi:helix-turn-helix domain-containing protein [Sphingopyxis witflariensis]|uniref:TetR family transcriptional regulator n=1 Tax=Sphingopyxis witflariensis TaxID=173675 RepID=A0A246K486_9SPHN|nr:helix-turn-helix domain-containing protein [Sphingopyxis witflariensis]OWR00403.1 TetR family transcriptional regulator [Sphingopyxis witflariensis]
MTSQADRNAARTAEGNAAILDAARAVIAQRGLAGMSLRTVAEHAGVSVGSISYRIGDRAALVTAIVDREIEIVAAFAQDWLARLDGIAPVAAGILPDLICEWLDLGERRTSAIVGCELALLASRDPQSLPKVAALFDAGETFWRDLLATTPGGAITARRIASYCIDEQPFSLLLSANADYRLLRQSTVRGLLRDDAELANKDWSNWHMLLVERLAAPAAAALDKAASITEGAKAMIAEHIADVVIAQGVGALSHRVIAEASTTAASSIAHHYPTQRDILFAGVEAIYRRMRANIEAAGGTVPGGGEVIRLTHESALTAIWNPAFLPFAIDMRRRRAENVHIQIAEGLGIPPHSDRPRVQAIVMALMGNGLRMLAAGETPLPAAEAVKTLLKNRTHVF